MIALAPTLNRGAPQPDAGGPGSRILPGSYSPRFAHYFGRYVARMLRSNFGGVRFACGTDEHLRRLDAHDGPAIVAINHASWWDPLVALFLARTYCPRRTGCAPMERAMLENFGLFRRLGIFGVDPECPHALRDMRDYVLSHFERDARATLWITPQGRFTDARAPIVLRPGVASIAARAQGVVVVSVAIEYVMWTEKKPELLLRAQGVPGPAQASTGGWHRALTRNMQANAGDLAALAIARNPAAFHTILESSHGVNPFMDLWARITGKSTRVVDRSVREERT